MIQVSQEARGGWSVVNVSGRADAAAAADLEKALRSAIEGNSKVAANFSALEYISSAGLRAVLQAARAAQTREGQFMVCAPSPMVQRVFDASGMHTVLRIQEALPC